MGSGRTSAIMDAVRIQLEQRRALIDQGDDIGQIVITVKLRLGTPDVKSVIVSDEHINRRVPLEAWHGGSR